METTHIKFTFPAGKLEPEYLHEELCIAEFGPITIKHVELAIMLIRDMYMGAGRVAGELFIDDLINLAELMKSNPGSNAFEIMKEELA
ncbi:MAG: hypothetical protein WBD30_03630 [Bacteroidota bacterium]